MNEQKIATLNFKRVAGSQDTTKLNQYQTKAVYEKSHRISWSSSFEEGFEKFRLSIRAVEKELSEGLEDNLFNEVDCVLY